MNIALDKTIRGKPDGVVDGSFIFAHNPCNEPEISFVDLCVPQLPVELLVSELIFCDNDNSGSIAINPMNGSIKAVLSLAFPIADNGIA